MLMVNMGLEHSLQYNPHPPNKISIKTKNINILMIQGARGAPTVGRTVTWCSGLTIIATWCTSPPSTRSWGFIWPGRRTSWLKRLKRRDQYGSSYKLLLQRIKFDKTSDLVLWTGSPRAWISIFPVIPDYKLNVRIHKSHQHITPLLTKRCRLQTDNISFNNQIPYNSLAVVIFHLGH